MDAIDAVLDKKNISHNCSTIIILLNGLYICRACRLTDPVETQLLKLWNHEQVSVSMFFYINYDPKQLTSKVLPCYTATRRTENSHGPMTTTSKPLKLGVQAAF